jgi:gamma-glutamyltranspeptidase
LKQVLEKGGSAIDAAIAMQAMSTLVEAKSSGIGGGSFILYCDNKNKKLHTFDGRETAPQKASPYIFVEDTNLPIISLINSAYLSERAKRVGLYKPFTKAGAGKPYMNAMVGDEQTSELTNTSHFPIVDKDGNAISMTTSIEFMFGSGVMVVGFLLNNQLTDFSLSPSKNGFQALNRVEPNKRPRSSMSPTMMFNAVET